METANFLNVPNKDAHIYTNLVSKQASRAQNDTKERQTLHDARTWIQKSNSSAKGQRNALLKIALIIVTFHKC